MTSPLPNVCSNLPLNVAMERLLADVTAGVRGDGWLVFEAEVPARLPGFWVEDALDTAIRQALVEEQAAEWLISDPLRRACSVVYAARGPRMDDISRPWPADATNGSMIAVVIAAQEATPVVVTQDVKLQAAGAALAAPRWQQPQLAHLPADLPGLVAFRSMQARHPVLRATRKLFGKRGDSEEDEGTWNR